MYEVVTSEIPMINAEELKFSIESGLIHTVASLMIIILAQVTTYVVVAAVFASKIVVRVLRDVNKYHHGLIGFL